MDSKAGDPDGRFTNDSQATRLVVQYKFFKKDLDSVSSAGLGKCRPHTAVAGDF